METFNFPYHKYSVDYPESGFKMELGGSYRYNAEPSAPDQRIFKLYFDTMLRYEAKYTKSGIIPSGNVNGDVWVDTGTQNLMLRSETLATWFTSASQCTVVSDGVLAPDGSTNADLIKENSVNGYHYLERMQSYGSLGTFTRSAHLKSGARNAFMGLYSNIDNHEARFNLISGVPTVTTTGNGTTAGATLSSNGYWRCWVKGTITSLTNARQTVGIANGSNTLYTGDGNSGIYVWGQQLEKSEGMGTYLPTTTSAVSTTGINKGYRFSNGVWVPTTNPSKLNLFSNPEINLGLLEDFYLRHKMWKKFIYPHPIYGDLAVRFSRPLILPKGYTDGNGTVEPFELEFIEVPGGL